MEYAVHLFNAGGIVMYPLVICMVAAWMIMFERIRSYRHTADDLDRLETAIEQGRAGESWDVFTQRLQADGSELNREVFPIVDTAVSFEGLENRLQDVVGYFDGRLKRGLPWLSMMVTMAPLLGLLGTVVGMIRSFAAVGGEIGAPTVITGGVSEALVATATGLSVAIVALVFYSYCANRVNAQIRLLERRLGAVLDIYNRSHRS